MTREAAIWIDPGRQGGSPCLHGTRIPVYTVVGHVAYYGTLDNFEEHYESGTCRRSLLAAVAWWVLWYPKSRRKDERALRSRWHDWAEEAWSAMWSCDDDATGIPDPPVEDDDPEYPTCARCGQPVDGYAGINDKWYCHPDDPDKPDCYTLASWELAR